MNTARVGSIMAMLAGAPPYERFRTVLLMLVGALLLFPNLDETYLWMDEAETAVLGKNILTYGYPRMFDGRNLMAYYPTLHNEAYAEVVLPWLQYYVCAASFLVFGVDTFTARLPFVLCGLAAIGLYPAVVRRLTPDFRVQALAPWLLTLSIPFLLYFRQSRYYALVILATLLLVWAYLGLGEKRRYAGIYFTLAAIALFHSHYVVCAGTLIGLGIHWLTVYRRHIPWTTVAWTGAVFLAGTVPWVLYAKFWTHGYAWFSLQKVGTYLGTLSARLFENFTAPLVLSIVRWLAFDRTERFWRWVCLAGGVVMAGATINLPFFPYLTAACFLAALGQGIRRVCRPVEHPPLHLVWMLPAGVILTLALLSPSDEIRYMSGLAPLVIVGVVLCFYRLFGRFPRFAVVCLALAWGTSIFNALPAAALRMLPFSAYEAGVFLSESPWAVRTGINRLLPPKGAWFHRMVVIDEAVEKLARFRSYPLEYFHELTHPYEGVIEGVSTYLNRYGTPDDTVIIDYGSVPLMFYTPMALLPEHLLSDSSIRPDWVVLHPGYHVAPSPEVRTLLETSYRKIDLPYPNALWDNRPELWFHHFRQPADSSRIAVYQLIR
ncbi:MAG: hypothetical protein FJY97_03085 [candidate division Zixibacteria bacterium]|nr:hypothetical protein [candidate division Zixibacteria bacterium]